MILEIFLYDHSLNGAGRPLLSMSFLLMSLFLSVLVYKDLSIFALQYNYFKYSFICGSGDFFFIFFLN